MRAHRRVPRHPAAGARIAVDGGRAGAVIDLANEHHGGGYDVERGPVRRQFLTPVQVSGPVWIGHTASLDDPEAPIALHQRPLLVADGGHVDARCRSCVARPALTRDGAAVVVILEHERGCAELERWLRRAGGAR